MEYYKKAWKTYKRFLKFLKPYWKVGVVVGILMLITALLHLPAPLLTKFLIDKIVPQKNLFLLNILCLILVGVILLSNLLSYIQQVMLVNYRINVERDIRKLLIEKILKGPLSYFEKNATGYLLSRIDADVDAVGHLFIETILSLLMDILTFIVGAGLLFYLNTKLAIVSIISLPVFIFSFHYFSKKMNELTMVKQEKWARFRGVITEILSEVKTLKLFGKKDFSIKRTEQSLEQALESDKKLEIYGIISGIAIGLTGVILPLFVLWYGVRDIILGNFTVGGFIAFNTCIGYLYDPVKSFVSLNIDIHSSIAAAERIFQIIDLKEEDSNFGSKQLSSLKRVEFKNVSFHYPEREEKSGIENISFTLNRGEKLAIVGETGSGKSTIVRLIAGFDTPEKGQILFNGVDYRGYSIEEIRKKIAIVPQEPPLLSGSIVDNIVFFENEYDGGFIEDLIELCALKKTIERFPAGLNTNVFEEGVGLSGGEKQRIAIARALYRKPDLLIFDEATSALDMRTEEEIFGNLLNLEWNPAIIWISHREYLLDRFDKVLRLEKDDKTLHRVKK